MKFVKSYITFLILIAAFFTRVPVSHASSTFSVINDVLSHLSCYDLNALASHLAGKSIIFGGSVNYSCFEEPSISVLANILIQPYGTAEEARARIRINDDSISALKGNCLLENRADLSNLTLSYGMCNNNAIWYAPAIAMTKAAVSIGEDLFTEPQNIPKDLAKIAESLVKPDPEQYTCVFENAPALSTPILTPSAIKSIVSETVGDITSVDTWVTFLTTGKLCMRTFTLDGGMFMLNRFIPFYIIPNVVNPVFFMQNVIRSQDKVCVGVLSIIGVYIPMGCKYIKEPYPTSIYYTGSDTSSIKDCSSVYNCVQNVKKTSQTTMSISAQIVTCVGQMVSRLLASPTLCNGQNGVSGGTSAFYSFQSAMRNAVMGILTIYTILFAVRIMLGAEEIKPKDIIEFLLKMFFVIYFTIGINGDSGYNGMTSYAFPFLLQGSDVIANWVTTAVGNGMCYFDPSDYTASTNQYDGSPQSSALWDSIDCRLTHYLGIDGILDSFVSVGDGKFPNLSSIPLYIYVFAIAMKYNWMTIASAALAYPIMILSFTAFIVTLACESLLNVAVIAVMSPIFVPMILFERTKGYFDAWVKLLFGGILRPVVGVAAITVMYAVYDNGYYSTCKFFSYNVKVPYYSSSMSGGKGTYETYTKKAFEIDMDPTHYDNSEQFAQCTESLAGMLYEQSPFVRPANATLDLTTADFDSTAHTDVTRAKKLGLQWIDGYFFKIPLITLSTLKTLFLSILTSCILLYVMRDMLDHLGDFVSDLAGSAGAKSTASAGAIQQAVSQKANAALSKRG